MLLILRLFDGVLTFEQFPGQRAQQRHSCCALIVGQSRLLVLDIGSEVVWERKALGTIKAQ